MISLLSATARRTVARMEYDPKIIEKRLETAKQALLAREDISQGATRTVELDQTKVGRLSRMDALQGQAMAQETERRRQAGLKAIEVAIARLKAGDYGYCATCDEEIEPKRLEHDPATALCLSCAR